MKTAEPNDPKLCLAMAKLLPEKIEFFTPSRMTHEGHEDGEACPVWNLATLDNGHGTRDILDTEWLYIMHLVEQTLTRAECYTYNDCLARQVGDWTPSSLAANWLYHATFNQRARAMCEVKGITP